MASDASWYFRNEKSGTLETVEDFDIAVVNVVRPLLILGFCEPEVNFDVSGMMQQLCKLEWKANEKIEQKESDPTA